MPGQLTQTRVWMEARYREVEEQLAKRKVDWREVADLLDSMVEVARLKQWGHDTDAMGRDK